jgi:hypothetical protein
MAREFPVDDEDWVRPAGERFVVVGRRLWPARARGLVVGVALTQRTRRRR